MVQILWQKLDLAPRKQEARVQIRKHEGGAVEVLGHGGGLCMSLTCWSRMK